ncbi:hypothetical protein B9Z19DRAFT_258640 [Tuber borchii]|uniref:Uncharacterized protein n=1 Tax=Tuber borchii TaxID=42251 RepID=A0A2T6ZLK8_TUBBO|nr:hypothetical protein B9Z19DRAFT_258640 [Tuber borchii]
MPHCDGIDVPSAFVGSASTASVPPQFPFHPPPVYLQYASNSIAPFMSLFSSTPLYCVSEDLGRTTFALGRERIYSMMLASLDPLLCICSSVQYPIHTYLPTYLPAPHVSESWIVNTLLNFFFVQFTCVISLLSSFISSHTSR